MQNIQCFAEICAASEAAQQVMESLPRVTKRKRLRRADGGGERQRQRRFDCAESSVAAASTLVQLGASHGTFAPLPSRTDQQLHDRIDVPVNSEPSVEAVRTSILEQFGGPIVGGAAGAAVELCVPVDDDAFYPRPPHRSFSVVHEYRPRFVVKSTVNRVLTLSIRYLTIVEALARSTMRMCEPSVSVTRARALIHDALQAALCAPIDMFGSSSRTVYGGAVESTLVYRLMALKERQLVRDAYGDDWRAYWRDLSDHRRAGRYFQEFCGRGRHEPLHCVREFDEAHADEPQLSIRQK